MAMAMARVIEMVIALTIVIVIVMVIVSGAARRVGVVVAHVGAGLLAPAKTGHFTIAHDLSRRRATRQTIIRG